MKRITAFISTVLCLILVFPFTSLRAGTTVTVNSDAELLSALSNSANTEIISNGALANLSFTVPAGVTLTLNIGGYVETRNGTLTNHGNVIINMSKYWTSDMYGEPVQQYNQFISYNTIHNYGNITINGRYYNCSMPGFGTGTINNYPDGVFTIGSGSRLTNESGAVIHNQGTIRFLGTLVDNGGTFINDGEVDQPVGLFKDGMLVGSYSTLYDAFINANMSGNNYEVRITQDITVDCSQYSLTPYPMVSNVTLSGKKNDGTLSTVTFTGGNYSPTTYMILKDINIVCTSGYNAFSGKNIGLQGEVHLPAGTTYSTVTVSGSSVASIDTLTCSTLNVAASTVFTAGSITAPNISLNAASSLSANNVTSTTSVSLASGSKLTATTATVKNLVLNGGRATINNTGLLNIMGAVSGSGGTVVLPLPTSHSGEISSMTFDIASSVGGSTAITIEPISGLSISNNTKLILLKNTAIAPQRFAYSDPAQIFTKTTLDGLTYLSLRDAPYPSALTQTPVAPITYGESTSLTVTARRSSTLEALTGNIAFYKGSTAIAGNLLGTVPLSDGIASYPLTSTQLNLIGSNSFLAVYSDPSNINEGSSILCSVNVTTKALTVTGASVNNKSYDGTIVAQLNSIALEGIIGSDAVLASGVAVFTDSFVGTNKNVNLSSVTLSGAGAFRYTVASSIDDVATTASINKALPMLNVRAEPNTDLAPGESITLTAEINGVPAGAAPTGSITFKAGATELATVVIDATTAQFIWNAGTDGSHTLTAEYNGDDCYLTVAHSITLDLSKRTQAAFSVDGIPSTVTYGDSDFSISPVGGNGSGVVSFEVISGSAVSVNSLGRISINSVGDTVIRVTKAGDTTYNPVSINVTIAVNKAHPTLDEAPVASSVYRGRTLAESVIEAGRVVGAFGEALDGAFAWVDTGTAVTDEGSFNAIFVPTSENYNPLPLTITVGLKRAVPTITEMPKASRVDIGSDLSRSTLTGGIATGLDNILLSGSFAWENPDEKVTSAKGFRAVFTPDNIADYDVLVLDVMVPVNTAHSSAGTEETGYVSDPDIETYGSTIWVNITRSTRITSLQADMLIKYNREHPIVFSGSDYTITFDVGEFQPDDTAYDFGASFRFGESENATINALVRNSLILTVSYNHSGRLPGKARIKFYVGTQYVGKTVYYYLYNPSSNRLEFSQAMIVNSQGYAEVMQTHCSTYLVADKRIDDVVSIPETGAYCWMNNVLGWLFAGLTTVFGSAE